MSPTFPEHESNSLPETDIARSLPIIDRQTAPVIEQVTAPVEFVCWVASPFSACRELLIRCGTQRVGTVPNCASATLVDHVTGTRWSAVVRNAIPIFQFRVAVYRFGFVTKIIRRLRERASALVPPEGAWTRKARITRAGSTGFCFGTNVAPQNVASQQPSFESQETREQSRKINRAHCGPPKEK